MRLALKTQAQARANIEALGALKNPPVGVREASELRRGSSAG